VPDLGHPARLTIGKDAGAAPGCRPGPAAPRSAATRTPLHCRHRSGPDRGTDQERGRSALTQQAGCRDDLRLGGRTGGGARSLSGGDRRSARQVSPIRQRAGRTSSRSSGNPTCWPPSAKRGASSAPCSEYSRGHRACGSTTSSTSPTCPICHWPRPDGCEPRGDGQRRPRSVGHQSIIFWLMGPQMLTVARSTSHVFGYSG
jgi:hypothetical protein